MRIRSFGTLVVAAALIQPGQALAQEEFNMNWHTIDCGGGQSSGEEWSITATIAQPDAGLITGPESVESFSIMGGFWIEGPTAPCYANCDGSSSWPVLTGNDFQCFLNKFAEGDPGANCDGSTETPALTPNDFQCFLNSFAAGCT